MIKLVIVEDETNVRECLEHLFPWNTLDVEVVASFTNGQSAYHYLMLNEADLLLTDIRLPGMTGLELVQKLRENQNMLPVIILTGYKQFDYAQQAIRYQVNDFLLKPIKYEDLTSAIIRIKEQILVTNSIDVSNVPSKIATYHDRIIDTAKHFVQDNLATASLESTALSVNLSTSYFSRLFHKITGNTFSDYLTSCRMEKAAKLLSNINYKTYEISLLVGYDNPKNFTRAFKQHYQITPREYRDHLSNHEKEKP